MFAMQRISAGSRFVNVLIHTRGNSIVVYPATWHRNLFAQIASPQLKTLDHIRLVSYELAISDRRPEYLSNELTVRLDVTV